MADPLIGAVLGGGTLRLRRLLGRGGMGAVYEAEHVGSGHQVAVKLLVGQELSSPEDRLMAVRRLADEARAARLVPHPGLVRLLESGEDEALGPYLVFEYLAGGTLRDELGSRKPLGFDGALERVARPLLEGLAALHAAGIVHRDVKPENLLRAPDGTYKLGDLGLAVFEGRLAATATGTFMGTPGYLAPERALLPELEPAPAADLYGAALTIVEAATGRLPWVGRSLIEVVKEQTARDPSASDLRSLGLPAPAARALAAVLVRDPAKRPGDAAGLLALLRTPAVETAPPWSATTTSRVPPKRVPSRRRWPALGLTVVLAAAAVWWCATSSRDQSAPEAPVEDFDVLAARLEDRVSDAERFHFGWLEAFLESQGGPPVQLSGSELAVARRHFVLLWEAAAAASLAVRRPACPKVLQARSIAVAGMLARRVSQLPPDAVELGAPSPAAHAAGAADLVAALRAAEASCLRLAREAGSLGPAELDAFVEGALQLVQEGRRYGRSSGNAPEGRAGFSADLSSALPADSELPDALRCLRSREATEATRGLREVLARYRADLASAAGPLDGREVAVEALYVAWVATACWRWTPAVAVETLHAELVGSLAFVAAVEGRVRDRTWLRVHRARLLVAEVEAALEAAERMQWRCEAGQAKAFDLEAAVACFADLAVSLPSLPSLGGLPEEERRWLEARGGDLLARGRRLRGSSDARYAANRGPGPWAARAAFWFERVHQSEQQKELGSLRKGASFTEQVRSQPLAAWQAGSPLATWVGNLRRAWSASLVASLEVTPEPRTRGILVAAAVRCADAYSVPAVMGEWFVGLPPPVLLRDAARETLALARLAVEGGEAAPCAFEAAVRLTNNLRRRRLVEGKRVVEADFRGFVPVGAHGLLGELIAGLRVDGAAPHPERALALRARYCRGDGERDPGALATEAAAFLAVVDGPVALVEVGLDVLARLDRMDLAGRELDRLEVAAREGKARGAGPALDALLTCYRAEWCLRCDRQRLEGDQELRRRLERIVAAPDLVDYRVRAGRLLRGESLTGAEKP